MLVRVLVLSMLVLACGRSEPKLGRSSSGRNVGRGDASTADAGAKDGGMRDAGCRSPEVSFYNNRAEWLARIGDPDFMREDFDQEPDGDPSLPYETARGLRLEGDGPLELVIQGPNIVFPTRHAGVRDFSSGLTIRLPEASDAFGFDYFSIDDGWILDVGGARMNIPGEMTHMFAGIVVECGQFDAFRLRGPAGAQTGLLFDEVTWR